MNRSYVSLMAGALLLGGCGGGGSDGGLDRETEAAAHDVLDDRLRAMVEDDWERVHELTAAEARPNDRARWLEQRSDADSTFEHKCLGEPTSRPEVTLETIDHTAGTVVVESQLWEQSDMARLCRWRVTEEAGTWRVGDLVAREAAS